MAVGTDTDGTCPALFIRKYQRQRIPAGNISANGFQREWANRSMNREAFIEFRKRPGIEFYGRYRLKTEPRG